MKSALSESSLAALLARHGPEGGRAQLPRQSLDDLATRSAAAVEAIVVVGDLRLSSILLREAVQPALFARFIIGFTEAVRSLTAARDGWFDKFTGDGFIAFWLRGGDETGASRVPRFCQTVLPAADALIANLRRNSRNFPVGVGLSLGIDAGPCQLVRVGDALTLVGAPIVGATRMVAGARARQTLVNIYFGESLEGRQAVMAEEGTQLFRTIVRTKEYPDGQEAFEMVFPRALHAAPESAEDEPVADT